MGMFKHFGKQVNWLSCREFYVLRPVPLFNLSELMLQPGEAKLSIKTWLGIWGNI